MQSLARGTGFRIGIAWRVAALVLVAAIVPPVLSAGVAAAKLWERHLLRTRGRAGLKQYLQSSRVRVIAIVCTINFECFSLLFFPGDIHTTLQMMQTVFSVVY